MAYGMDRLNDYNKSQVAAEEKAEEAAQNQYKTELRSKSRQLEQSCKFPNVTADAICVEIAVNDSKGK